MILIAPYSSRLKSGKPNAKNYPYWKELVAMIKVPIVQIGVEGDEQLVGDFRKNLSFQEIETLISECELWISVDSFLPHMASHLKKPGIVLWGVSDPNIFGYATNVNLLKDRKFLRPDQFGVWEGVSHTPDAFVSPEEVIKHIEHVWNC